MYRVVTSPFHRPSDLALARTYPRVEEAVANMGEGLVVADDGHLVAFHERHLPVIERRSQQHRP